MHRLKHSLRLRPGIIFALALGFFLRAAVAFWNGFFGPSFGAEGDAQEFHLRAIEILAQRDPGEFVIGWIYSQFLALIYSVTSESLFFGSLLSCIAWLFSAFFLLGICKEVYLDKRITLIILLIYSLLPTSIFHTSITLREAYQSLFVNLSCGAALRLLRRDHWRDWMALIFGCAGMSVLHGALATFAGIFLLSLYIFRRRHSVVSMSRRIRFKSIYRVAIVAAAACTLLYLAAPSIDNELIESLLKIQQGYVTVDARAQYRFEIDFDNISSIILYFPVSVIQYLFEPFPWRGLSVVDVGLILENILRATLIFFCIKGFRRLPKRQLSGVPLLIIAYVAQEAIWAPGTVNWGTAARHHIPSFGILLVCAFACQQANHQFSKSRRGMSHPIAPDPIQCQEY